MTGRVPLKMGGGQSRTGSTQLLGGGFTSVRTQHLRLCGSVWTGRLAHLRPILTVCGLTWVKEGPWAVPSITLKDFPLKASSMLGHLFQALQMGPRGFSRQPAQLLALMSMGCLPAGGVGGPAGDRRGSGTSPGNKRPACTPFLAEHLLFESANPSFSSPAPNLAFGRASIFMNKVKIAQKADSPFPAPRPSSSLAQ